MDTKIKGKVLRFGEHINTDDIIAANWLVTGDPVELGKHAFEIMRPGFSKSVEKGDIIVADENFGCGSSREHAPRALMGCGIACVVARSFARIFYRNSINIGLSVVECDIEASEGDTLEIDFQNGIITNLATNKTFNFIRPPEFLTKMIEAGGLVAYTREKLASTGCA